jgi:hypothetical protein
MYAYMQYPLEERDLKVNDKNAQIAATGDLKGRGDSANNIEFANRVTRDIQEQALQNPADLAIAHQAMQMIEKSGREQKPVDMAQLDALKLKASAQMRQYLNEAAMVTNREVDEKLGQRKAVVDRIKQNLDTSGQDMVAIGDDPSADGYLKELMKKCQDGQGQGPQAPAGPGQNQGR